MTLVPAQSYGSQPNRGGVALRGVLERIIYYNEETHYCIAELRSETTLRGRPALTTITGSLPGVQCGETLKVTGVWSHHRTHGEQFKIQSFESTLPATVYGIRKFLGSGMVRGIGKTYAEKIVAQFGTETLRIISEDSGRLREVPGIGLKRARDIKKAWDEQASLREVLMFLQTYGIGVSQCLKLVRIYGSSTHDIIRADPYLVAREISGIGFKTADRIAINLGFANESPKRLDAGILFAMQEFEADGHTASSRQALEQAASALLNAESTSVANRIDKLLEGGVLRLSSGGDLIQLPGTEVAERNLATSLQRIIAGPPRLPPIQVDRAIAWAQERVRISFSKGQVKALRSALVSRLAILTGGPGTGKTTILRAFVEILNAKHAKVILGAPTGRAAQRLAEAVGQPAQTLHRLLRFDPAVGRFTADQTAPLRCDCIIIDEASMLDTRLAAALLCAVPSGATVLLVGDTHQLPSIGPGSVLQDLIMSGAFSVTSLDCVFRQQNESLILKAAYRILEGNSDPLGTVSDIESLRSDHDFQFLIKRTPEQCVETIRTLCRDWIPQNLRCDAMRDIQVIAPMHKGIAGIANLNTVLQDALNQEARSNRPSGTFRTGDKVIQLINDYEKGIFNGDFGYVREIDADAGRVVADFDGRTLTFEKAELSDLQLAYAISVHKSQGSEFPVVIVPLLKQHFMLLQRNLLYTAITRGRAMVIVVGDPSAYAIAVANRESLIRRTDLERKICALLDR